MEINILADIELRRYKKQIEIAEIKEEGQLKLKFAKILVVGAGGLGTSVLQYLASVGVGTIGICDADIVNESNLFSQIMFGSNDLGKLKTIIAKEKLTLLNPLVNYEIINIFVKPENVENVIHDYEIIVDCSNNYDISEIILQACIKLKKPLIWGMVLEFKGLLSVFQNSQVEKIKNIFSKTLDFKNKNGSIGSISGIIGSLQANEVIKLILKIGEPLSKKVLIYDGLKNSFQLESI